LVVLLSISIAVGGGRKKPNPELPEVSDVDAAIAVDVSGEAEESLGVAETEVRFAVE
jgi:hypothetical protein